MFKFPTVQIMFWYYNEVEWICENNTRALNASRLERGGVGVAQR